MVGEYLVWEGKGNFCVFRVIDLAKVSNAFNKSFCEYDTQYGYKLQLKLFGQHRHFWWCFRKDDRQIQKSFRYNLY